MELVNEGRLLSHAMRERIVMTTSEAFVIVNKLDEISRQKHMQFVELCRLTEATYNESDKLQDQLLLATKRRDFSVARNVIQKVYKIFFSALPKMGDCYLMARVQLSQTKKGVLF